MKVPENGVNVCVITCDLQKVLQCPSGQNNLFFYKSRLSAYNFTVYVSGEQKGYCYVWDQTEAKKGCVEISSCLWQFINMKVLQGCNEFRIYSVRQLFCTEQKQVFVCNVHHGSYSVQDSDQAPIS